MDSSRHKLTEIEREEGEIVEDLNYLSDISSEEEFLLRQRLEVLENYNNVLERKKAKRSSIGSGHSHQKHIPLPDLSDISASELEENYCSPKKTVVKEPKQKVRTHRRLRKHKDNSNNVIHRAKDLKKNQHSKKKKDVKVILESSDDSDDEYRFKRRKLADAVVVHKEKNEKSSLSSRLREMLHKAVNREPFHSTLDNKKVDIVNNNKIITHDLSSPTNPNTNSQISNFQTEDKLKSSNLHSDSPIVIITSTEDETNTQDSVQDLTEKSNTQSVQNVDTVNSIDNVPKSCVMEKHCNKDSDEDLETLRQTALSTKIVKASNVTTEKPTVANKIVSDDEDSDTAELRMICLKSTLLKKAIEMKQKQKREKKLSQSYRPEELIDSLYDDLNNHDSDNNTDKEFIDMELQSDETDDNQKKVPNLHKEIEIIDNQNFDILPLADVPKQEEFDDDEDLLRAKLLTSLSKNLPNLVRNQLLNVPEPPSRNVNTSNSDSKSENIPEEKKFIIKLGESDSEGENEATKNLTKMHMKLEEISFATKLDRLLKSTRMQVEKKDKDTDTVGTVASVQREPKKFVAKALNNLPKSEQIEYRNLVRRMAELEKLKQQRQLAMNYTNRLKMNETLKPKNKIFNSDRIVTVSNLEDQIATSRKKIAEESSKMMKLKEEALKLSQKYKIAATELRNISTAIHINKKHQRAIQNSLTRIRNEHQRLIQSAPTLNQSQLSKINTVTVKKINKPSVPKVQKENNPTEKQDDTHKNTTSNKNNTGTVPEQNESVKTPMLSIQVDVSSNRKVIKLPPKIVPKVPNVPVDLPSAKLPPKTVHDCLSESMRDRLGPKNIEGEKTSDDPTQITEDCNKDTVSEPEVKISKSEKYEKLLGEYISPLDSLCASTWGADPNAILCPFEVGGDCKDTECKFLHINILTQ